MKKLWIGLTLLAVLLLVFAGMACAEEQLTLNKTETVEISAAGDVAIYSFTPATDGLYRFYSILGEGDTEYDTYGYLLDEDMQLIVRDDDGGGEYQFRIVHELTANRKYYFGMTFYDSSTTGAFQVKLEKIESVYAAAKYSRYYTQYGRPGTVEIEAFSPNGGLTYQWYDGETAIEGATDKAYHFPAITEVKDFRCVVTDSANHTAEAVARVRINPRMSISVSGGGRVEYGGNATLHVTATAEYGADQITYSWFEMFQDEDGSWYDEILEGETGPALSLSNITHSRYFICRITDINGDDEGYDFYIYVDGAVDITASSGPQGAIAPGDSVTMSVTAVSENYGPISYKWYLETWEDDEWYPVPGANGPTCTIDHVYTGCTYICQATNSVGNTASHYFAVEVEPAFDVQANGEPEIVITPSETAEMKVTAVNNVGEVSYQWFRFIDAFERFVPIKGATSASYPVSGNSKAGSYFCRATDTATGLTRRIWFNVIIVNEFTMKADSGTELSVTAGSAAELKVRITPEGTDVSYRWYRREYDAYNDYYGEWIMIEGAQTDTLVITANQKCAYECVAFDRYDNFAAVVFDISIDNEFSVTAETKNYDVNAGDSVTLSALGTCTNGQITYRWDHYENYSEYRTVKESTESFLTIDEVGADNYGEYRLYAFDSYGNSESIYYYISAENHLTVTAASDEELTVYPGDNVTLAVEATCDSGKISYLWYGQTGDSVDSWYYDPIWEETQATLELTNIRCGKHYFCRVYDQFGGEEEIYFRIIVDNEFSAAPLDDLDMFTVEPGETVTMTVAASCRTGGLNYQWYQEVRQHTGDGGYHWTRDIIEGATEETYTTGLMNARTDYFCRVSDECGNTEEVWFYVYLDNGLSADRIGPYTRLVEPGTEVTMEVDAVCYVGGITYEWFRYSYDPEYESWDSRTPIEGETGNTLTITADDERVLYSCYVYDDYGDYDDVDFMISIENGLEFSELYNEYIIAVPYGEQATITAVASCRQGEIEYQWYDSWWNLIEGATGPSFTPDEPVTETRQYNCRIRDQYQNTADAWFYVEFNSGLTAEPEGDCLFDLSDTPITLAVNADNLMPDAVFSYYWYSENYGWLDSTSESSYTLTDPQAGRYYCDVSDEHQSRRVWFYIHDGTSMCYADEGNLCVDPGEEVTLKVVAWSPAGEITYQWLEENEAGEPVEITGANAANYTLVANDRKTLYCRVEWSTIQDTLEFDINIRNNFHSDWSNNSKIHVIPAGGSVRLAVSMSSKLDDNLTYQWKRNGEVIPDATDNTLTVTTGGTYLVIATDRYGNHEDAEFWCVEGQSETVNEGQKVTVAENGTHIYQFIPNITGTYQLETEGSCHLYRLGSMSEFRELYNESLTARMDAGEVYYAVIYENGSSFRYTLMQEVQTEYTITLQPGKSLRFPELYINGDWIPVNYARTDNRSIVSVESDVLNIRKAGTANVTVSYGNGTQRVYHITATTGNTLVLPDELQVIEADAFNGDTSVRFMKLGDYVYTVERGAFANMGSINVTVENAYTTFEEGVFTNSSPLVICHDWGYVESYCMNHGIPYLYMYNY